MDPILTPRPPYSLMPFWFWNDGLEERELLRQIADFQDHGVHGFVIHPRVGLPRDMGWMSPRLLGFMRLAIEEAVRRGMTVFLYDEGMYPSGSSSGQVVAANPAYQCRCLEARAADAALAATETLVARVARANGQRVTIVDRPLDSVIRGLHYTDEATGAEDEPVAADILNPEAVATFIRLVYDGFYAAFPGHFGKTIQAIFTDEPSLVGRPRQKKPVPGTTGILAHVNRLLGYDFTPHLPALFFDDEPEAARFRQDYHRALKARLEETYYGPLAAWCKAHNVALTGHPAEPDDLGIERHFAIPGQDLVWRYVEPHKPSALEGPQSTQAKVASSAAEHLGRERNLNEFCGAYGHSLTFDQMKWLADWCLVRGTNLLVPHAFYYSTRGPRKDERPPDVGPHAPWWPQFKPFADYCARMSALVAESRHACDIAVLALSDHAPWRAAKVLYENQLDFNYLEARHLWEDAEVNDVLGLGDQAYTTLILDGIDVPSRARAALRRLQEHGIVVHYDTDEHLVATLRARCGPPLVDPPVPDLRIRRMHRGGSDYVLFFNEGSTPIATILQLQTPASSCAWLDLWAGTERLATDGLQLDLAPHQTAVLRITS